MAIHQQAQPLTCSTCGYAGCDVRIKGCGCSFHARCIDLAAICHRTPGPVASSNSAAVAQQMGQQNGELANLRVCPGCSSPATGLGIIPLSFAEMDQAQRLCGASNHSGISSSASAAAPGKRMHASDDEEATYYDPSTPRTGKWSDEEIAFRDDLVPHFVEGSLPLQNGLKLIEFLSQMLKSKPSRLTKKMKHAKLSTRHYNLESGFIRSTDRAKELSRLELAFFNGISDAVERTEIKFHMQKEWRDYLAERLTYLRISFDAEEWLKSVDVMDRRITLAKSRNRMVKRRFMMGKALEKDRSSATPGIFIDQGLDINNEDVDLELLASALEANDAEDADLHALYTSMAADNTPHASTNNGAQAQEVSIDGSGRSRISNASASEAMIHHQASFRSALLPSLGSAEGPNFKFAAPFLAKITAYMERNRVPFEQVDIWVPSSTTPELDPTGATAPEPSLLGSGSANAKSCTSRLCFAGSASVGVQIMPDIVDESSPSTPSAPLATSSTGYKAAPKIVPLSSDEIYHMSLFGSYSEKFSFSSGCGLPGRVYGSAVPAWEQFVANAPSHLFERRGGAMQFGIKTALGLPIRSPNVGRIVLVLYSRHNREKNDGLVAQMVRDFQSLNPSPRWKLMVDMGNPATPGLNPVCESQPMVQHQPEQVASASNAGSELSQQLAGLSEKNIQISSLISLLGENMPSDQSTPLGHQLHNIMSLRMILLRKNRSAEEEHLVDSILTLFGSYITVGRSRPDTTLMLARDFAFHTSTMQQQQYQQPGMPLYPTIGEPPVFQQQMSLPTMQQLSIGNPLTQQAGPTSQLDHMHHGQQAQRSHSIISYSEGSHVQPMATQSAGSFSSLTERNYSNPDFQVSPCSASASLTRLGSKHHQPAPLTEPPSSLPS